VIPSSHERDVSAPAPGDLEYVRSFLSLHDHVGETERSVPPAPSTIERWLRTSRLLNRRSPATEDDLRWAADVQSALRATVPDDRRRVTPKDLQVLNDAARAAEVRVRFGEGDPTLEPDAGGVRGAVGRLLGFAAVAAIDGSWSRLKTCESETCLGVFYDRSRNQSGRWCSMQVCGNRAKVRAFRRRHARSE
jgi:predicted RNA-binding Zn ribbon-like protein